MNKSTTRLALLVVGGVPVACSDSHSDSVDISCVETGREPYTGEGDAEKKLEPYVEAYLALAGTWMAQVSCVDGSAGEAQVVIDTAPSTELEIASYEGRGCGATNAVVAVSLADLDSEMLEVGVVSMATTVAAGTGWAVVQMSGSASNGTGVLIEMSGDGTLRGSTLYSEANGDDLVTSECELADWVR